MLLPLCNELKISVNELLSGERLLNDEYKDKAEENLVDIISKERKENKKKIGVELMVGIPCMIAILSIFMMAGLLEIEEYQRVLLLIFGFILLFVAVFGLCYLDKDIGYFECKHCNERFVPSLKSYIFGMHGTTWRRLKCPPCGKVSNCKKRLNK